MNIQELGQKTLNTSRAQKWAGFETSISRPVPQVAGGQTRLRYLLYSSHVRGHFQELSQPYGAVTVAYPGGEILEHQELPTAQPLPIVGRYPHAAAASYPKEQWPAVWGELFGLYPDVIAAFAGQEVAGRSEKVGRFAELWKLTVPPFMEPYYRSLNPAFFDWLARAG